MDTRMRGETCSIYPDPRRLGQRLSGKPGLNSLVGSHLFAGDSYYHSLHGIGLPNGSIACQLVDVDTERGTWQSWIVELTYDQFATQGEVHAAIYPSPCDDYDHIAAARRATDAVGAHLTGHFAITGDNFAIWCVSGTPLRADSDTFGQQLATKRCMGAYEHHGVGIEHGLVVEFNLRPGSSVLDKVAHKVVCGDSEEDYAVQVVSMKKFEKDGKAEPVSQENRRFHPVHARNRAINLLGIPLDYDLLQLNCENIASWCVTGQRCSEQAQRAVGTALARAAALVLGWASGRLAQGAFLGNRLSKSYSRDIGKYLGL